MRAWQVLGGMIIVGLVAALVLAIVKSTVSFDGVFAGFFFAVMAGSLIWATGYRRRRLPDDPEQMLPVRPQIAFVINPETIDFPATVYGRAESWPIEQTWANFKADRLLGDRVLLQCDGFPARSFGARELSLTPRQLATHITRTSVIHALEPEDEFGEPEPGQVDEQTDPINQLVRSARPWRARGNNLSGS